MFHSTPKLVHISSQFDSSDPGRRKSQLVSNWQHVCFENAYGSLVRRCM